MVDDGYGDVYGDMNGDEKWVSGEVIDMQTWKMRKMIGKRNGYRWEPCMYEDMMDGQRGWCGHARVRGMGLMSEKQWV